MNQKQKFLSIGCLVATLLSSVLACASFGTSKESDPQVVDSVDLQKYQGLWYEIAHSPNFFQRSCVRSTAEYTIIDAETIGVYNTCFKKDGSTSDISGKAKITDPAVPAKLKVRFNFFARGDYWIIDLDPTYQWAVVSAPQKKSLFILARQSPMPREVLEKILLSLKSKGFEINKLVFDR